MSEKELLEQYRSLIDFTSKDEANNFKWVVSFLNYQRKKHPDEDNVPFLRDLIEIHREAFVSRRFPTI